MFYIFAGLLKSDSLNNERRGFIQSFQNILALFVHHIVNASVINIANSDFDCSVYSIFINYRKQLIKVACIGDSITHGSTSDDENRFNYPAYLQRLLGYDYYVEKYGAPGFSMTSTDTYAYLNHGGLYKPSLNAKADVVIIMLGTNDSNRDQAWGADSSARFEEGYRNLLNAIKEKNANMTYFMMNCPVYSGGAQFGSRTVRDLQKKLTNTLIGEGWDLHFFDMYTYTKDVVTIQNFPDGLHPGDKGYVLLADGVAQMLEDYRASLD